MIERTLGSRLLALARKFPVVTLTGPRQPGKATLCHARFADLCLLVSPSETLEERRNDAVHTSSFSLSTAP